MSESLRKQAELAQAEQQRQAQQAAEARAREEKSRQEDEAKREEEQRRPKEQRPFDQVEASYRYVMDDLKRSNERWEASQERAEARQVWEKESPAMERYKAHERDIAEKVQEHIKAGQNQAQELSQGQEHTR